MRGAPVILGYHGIADVDPRHDPVRLFVRPRDLRRQVERMRSRGYRFLTVADFARELAAGSDMAGTCALTFDDGTEDHLTTLAPLLDELGVPGTVYVCPGLFGDPYPWCDPAAGVRLMICPWIATWRLPNEIVSGPALKSGPPRASGESPVRLRTALIRAIRASDPNGLTT